MLETVARHKVAREPPLTATQGAQQNDDGHDS